MINGTSRESLLAAMSIDELEELAQRLGEAQLDACYDWMIAENEDEADGPDPATYPFDGCNTCIVREVLRASWPPLRELARRGRT